MQSYMTSIHNDELFLTIRRNGKLFYIDVSVSPSRFVNSPRTTEKCLSYLKVFDCDPGDGDLDDTNATPDITEDHVIDWAVQPFEPLLAELAPDPAPGNVEVTLRENLYPEFFVFELDVVDEELRPRRVESEDSPSMPPGVMLREVLREGNLFEGFPDEEGFRDEGFFEVNSRADDDLSSREDFLDDIRRWSRLYNPSEVVLSFDRPKDALFCSARKVLVDNGQTACFFKQSYHPLIVLRELRAYKKLSATNLDPEVRINRLHGVVWDDQRGYISGLLMLYIDNCGPCRETIFGRLHDDPPAHVRERWAVQIDTAVAEIHGAGIVWGDVEPHKVIVDLDDNAWITHFGGGYTEGWVDADLARTVEGDLAGVAEVKEFIFRPNFNRRVFNKHV